MENYIKKYQLLLSQAKNANVKFGTITIEEQKLLVTSFKSQIEWWKNADESPEDISIVQFEQMPREKQAVLLNCIKTPRKWRIHYPLYNVKSI